MELNVRASSDTIWRGFCLERFPRFTRELREMVTLQARGADRNHPCAGGRTLVAGAVKTGCHEAFTARFCYVCREERPICAACGRSAVRRG